MWMKCCPSSFFCLNHFLCKVSFRWYLNGYSSLFFGTICLEFLFQFCSLFFFRMKNCSFTVFLLPWNDVTPVKLKGWVDVFIFFNIFYLYNWPSACFYVHWMIHYEPRSLGSASNPWDWSHSKCIYLLGIFSCLSIIFLMPICNKHNVQPGYYTFWKTKEDLQVVLNLCKALFWYTNEVISQRLNSII